MNPKATLCYSKTTILFEDFKKKKKEKSILEFKSLCLCMFSGVKRKRKSILENPSLVYIRVANGLSPVQAQLSCAPFVLIWCYPF